MSDTHNWGAFPTSSSNPDTTAEPSQPLGAVWGNVNPDDEGFDDFAQAEGDAPDWVASAWGVPASTAEEEDKKSESEPDNNEWLKGFDKQVSSSKADDESQSEEKSKHTDDKEETKKEESEEEDDN